MAVTQKAHSERYQRHRTLIDVIKSKTQFRLEQIKALCPHETPAFVTRVVTDLEKRGWLVQEAGESNRVYRWRSNRGEFSVSKWLDEKLIGSKIPATPEQDRPRERLLAGGAASLRTAELLAILIRTGRAGESALQAGEKIANYFDGRLPELPHSGRGELKSISGAVADTAYCQIMAGIELGRRVTAMSDAPINTKIGSSREAKLFCAAHFSRLARESKQEEFHIVTLDTKNGVIDTHQITVGTLDASLVHPREVFRRAIKDAASSVLLVHNHPSGDPTPSPEDFAVTRRLEKAGQTIGIEVLDHIVLGRGSSTSIRESDE